MAWTMAVPGDGAFGDDVDQLTLNRAVNTPVAVSTYWTVNEDASAASHRLEIYRSTSGSGPVDRASERTNTNTATDPATHSTKYTTTPPTKSGSTLVALGVAQTTAALHRTVGWRNTLPRKPLLVDSSKQLDFHSPTSSTQNTRTGIFNEPFLDRPARPIRGRRGRTNGEWFHTESRRGITGATTQPNRGGFPMEFRMLQVADWDVVPTEQMPAALVATLLGGGTGYTQSLDGTITPAGALVKSVGKPLAGGITPAGLLVKAVARSLTGALTPSGALVKRAGKVLAGGITPAGALTAVKVALLTVTGAITPAGALVKQAGKALAGGITPAGALVKAVGKPLAGALTPAGLLVKRVGKTLTGGLTPSGALTAVKVALLTVAGTIAPAGALVKRAGKGLTGALAPTGTLLRQSVKAFAGTLAPAGSLVKAVARRFTGTITPAATLANLYHSGGFVPILRAVGTWASDAAADWAGGKGGEWAADSRVGTWARELVGTLSGGKRGDWS